MTASAPPTIGSEVQRLTEVAYRAGVDAGQRTAVAHIEYLAREAWADLRQARSFRDRSHREMTDHRVWAAVADRHAAHLVALLATRRALRGAHR